MKTLRLAILSMLLLSFPSLGPAFAQEVEDLEYQQWVEYRDGQISVAFDRTPVRVALHVIRARTGLEIVLPPASESKWLNLRLSQTSLEPAVRSLLSSIGFKSFALMYDETGRPNRAVVLETRPADDASPVANSTAATQRRERAAKPLTAEERDKLQKELERWGELKAEERARIEEELKALPPSEEREQLVKEYGRQVLGLKN